jgi:hypothetical protein
MAGSGNSFRKSLLERTDLTRHRGPCAHRSRLARVACASQMPNHDVVAWRCLMMVQLENFTRHDEARSAA